MRGDRDLERVRELLRRSRRHGELLTTRSAGGTPDRPPVRTRRSGWARGVRTDSRPAAPGRRSLG